MYESNILNVHRIIGLNSETYGMFQLIMLVIAAASATLALAVGVMATSLDAAAALGVPMLIIAVLFGGFYIDIGSLPFIADIIPNFSIIRWGFMALAINEFKGLQFNCDNPDPSVCITTGEEVLASLDFDGQTVNDGLFGLFMLMIGFSVYSYVIMLVTKIKYTPLGYTGKLYTRETSESGSAYTEK